MPWWAWLLLGWALGPTVGLVTAAEVMWAARRRAVRHAARRAGRERVGA